MGTDMRARLALCALLLASPAVGQTQAQPYSPPWQPSVQGIGNPGLNNTPLFLWQSGSFTDRPTLRIDRHSDSGSGTAWHTYKGLWGLCSTNPGNAGFEWCGSFELHNNGLASVGAQNVASNGTVFKETPPGGGSVGPSWGGNFICMDMTGEVDPAASCIGAELDVSALSIAGKQNTDANRQRVVLQLVGGGGEGVHTGYGILMGVNGGMIDRAVYPTGSYGLGLDFTGASFSTAPIVLGDNQSIGLDSTYKHGIAYAGGEFMFWGTGGKVFGVNDRGRFLSGYSVEFAPAVPTRPTDACEVGQHAWDASWDYRCIAPNRWRRAALSDW